VQAAARREAASGDGDRAAAAVSDARTAPAASAAPAVGRAAEPEPGGWLSRLLRLVGADLEHDWLTRAAMPLSRHPAPAGTAAGHPAPDLPMPADPAAAAESGEHAARESLKSILLQLRAHDELPAPFKETIQQTIQQITGQQLLLSTDRSGTFIQMTLFLPMLPGQDGQRPASVHIQSRKKGKQGALDADNCRLLFDLHLGFLGALLIDVQVVDRYVNVTLHHDDPRIKEWAAGERPSLEEALEKMGYRCAQLRCVPLPEPHPAEGAERGAGDPAAGGRRLPVRASQPYKGVDVRI
jgi:hypothetical protein